MKCGSMGGDGEKTMKEDILKTIEGQEIMGGDGSLLEKNFNNNEEAQKSQLIHSGPTSPNKVKRPVIVAKKLFSSKKRCDLCDPICDDDLKLAVMSTLCCWLWLGVLPVVFGILSIYYAKKAKSAQDEVRREHYSNLSRNISWIGMVLFTAIITLLSIGLATFKVF